MILILVSGVVALLCLYLVVGILREEKKQPTGGKNDSSIGGLSISFLIFVGLTVYGIYRIQSPDVEGRQTNFAVLSNEIYGDYDSNEVSAEIRYDGKVVEITGEVSEIRRTWLLDDLLQESTIYMDGGSGYIHVIVQDQHKGEITNLETRDVITVKGEVDGFRGGSLIIKRGSIFPN